MIEMISIDALNKITGFVVVHQNIRSMRENFDIFVSDLSILTKLPKVIVFSEIWIKESERELYKIDNYSLYLKTNELYRAGGVAIFVHDSVNVLQTKVLDIRSADVLQIYFKLHQLNIAIVAVYRNHKQPKESFLDDFKQLLNDQDIAKCKNICIIGDINLNLLEDNNNIIDEYKITFTKYGFESLINEPTRITETTSTCIDHALVKTNNKNKLMFESAVINNGLTDHCAVAVWFRCLPLGGDGAGDSATASDEITGDRRRRFRVDYQHLRTLLRGFDWSNVLKQKNASDAYSLFSETLLNLISKSKKEINNKTKFDKLKPWIDLETCKRVETKNQLLKRVKANPNNNDLKNYFKSFRNKLQKDIRALKNNYYNNLFSKFKGNSKKTWNVIKEITGQSYNSSFNKISLEVDNVLLEDPLKVANELNNYFLSIAETLNKNNNMPKNFNECTWKNYFKDFNVANSIFLTPVDKNELVSVIKSLKNGTSPGIDGINSILIKEIHEYIIDVLLYIINLSFTTGDFPEKMKEAVVIPIYKKGSKSLCSNYRPISLISSFSKIVEKLMKCRLVSFLESKCIFSKRQFGFRQGLSTEIALYEFMNKIYNGINDGNKVSGLFLDITKAFDTVNHGILLEKLYNCGIRGNVYNWFKSYLTGRRQCVKINYSISDFGEIKYGVPQGSVLGATLFLIYINDLCEANFKGGVFSFADDTALCYVRNTWEEIESDMNIDLQALRWWFIKNNMTLSTDKTKFLNFSLRGENINLNNITYKCGECLCNDKVCQLKCSIVGKVDYLKYLGVTLDSKLTMKIHINGLKKNLLNLLRHFYYLRPLCDNDLLRTLYLSIVHSRLDYGLSFWGGTYLTNLKPLVTLQKQFVRIITKKARNEPSRPLFTSLKILPLRYMFAYKILKIFYVRSRGSNDENEYRTKLRTITDFIVPRPKNTFFTKTCSFLAPKIFNSLPADIRQEFNLNIFLRKLRIWLFLVDNIEELCFNIQS
jgi:hypothetical protein